MNNWTLNVELGNDTYSVPVNKLSAFSYEQIIVSPRLLPQVLEAGRDVLRSLCGARRGILRNGNGELSVFVSFAEPKR